MLSELKQAYPGNTTVLDLEGLFALQQNRPRDAVDIFKTVMQSHPGSKVVTNLAEAQIKAGETESGLKSLEEWLITHPGDQVVRIYLSNLCLLLGKRDKAEMNLEIIIEQAPTNSQALNTLAWLIRGKEPKKALEYAERAKSLAPDSPYIMDTLAMILLDKGEGKRALKLLTDAVNIVPEQRTINYHLAQALINNQKDQQARKVLEKILSI